MRVLPTLTFVHPSALPDLLEVCPDATVIDEQQLRKGEIGEIDGRVNVVTMTKVVPFDQGKIKPPPVQRVQGRKAQWKTERDLRRFCG